jgi:hypothetical protein
VGDRREPGSRQGWPPPRRQRRPPWCGRLAQPSNARTPPVVLATLVVCQQARPPPFGGATPAAPTPEGALREDPSQGKRGPRAHGRHRTQRRRPDPASLPLQPLHVLHGGQNPVRILRPRSRSAWPLWTRVLLNHVDQDPAQGNSLVPDVNGPLGTSCVRPPPYAGPGPTASSATGRRGQAQLMFVEPCALQREGRTVKLQPAL